MTKTSMKIYVSSVTSSAYGIYNYTNFASSSTTDTSRDTINLDINNCNITVEGNSLYSFYGIYNSTNYGRDIIEINLQNTTLDVINNRYADGESWANAYGIYNYSYNNSSSFIYNTIKGGRIKATGTYKRGNMRCGIYNSGRNIAINLGTKEESDDVLTPSIFGDIYGIYSNSSNAINFSQGIIKGKSAISDKTILSLEEGKEVNRYIDETDGYDTIVIQNKTPEAKIGETEYMTLQEAIDACPDDSEEFTTIELIKEINNNAQNVTVEETKKVTLDLKGYNLTSLAGCTIINKGDLNILDSEGTGEIKNNANIAIGNYGNLNVDNIKIYGYTSGITNYSNGNVELNQVEINSTLKGIDNQTKANMMVHSSKIIMDKGKYGIYNSYGTVDMIDSEISVTYGESAYGIYNSGNNTTTTYIKNTNISVTCTSTQPYIYRGYGIYISSGTVNIGEKDNSVDDTSIITSSHIGIYRNGSNDSSSSGILNYYGGTITAGERVIQGAIDDTPEDKTISIDTEAQNMSLVDKQKGNVVQIGDIQYATLSEAVETVSAGQEENTLIKVIADFDITSIEEQVNIVANQKINLDLNGYTITSYINNVINNSGKLEIIDTSELKDGKLISVFNTGINNKSEFTLNQGTIQAVRNGVYNSTGGSITVNNGAIEVLAQDRGSSAAIYANGTGNIKLLGGTIKGVKNQWSVWTESGSSYIAGLVLNSSYAEIDGANILVENNTNYCTYGIVTNHSTIDFKSGILEVNTNRSGAWNYGISGMRGYKQDGNDIRVSGGSIKILRDEVNYIYGIYLESYSNTSQLTMTGGTIEAINTKEDSSTMATAIGTVSERKPTVINILGGRVYASSTGGGTAISGSTNSTYGTTTEITIGSKDGNMNKTAPVIEGSKYGISSGNLKFYDGTIRGATALTQLPVDVEAGYKVSIASSGELQSATLTLVSTAEAIAQIGNLYFNDLQQAINACTELDTINILTGIKCNQTLTIEEGKTVTIDLMGNTLTANGIENIIENYGTLTIIDSVGGGSINGEIDNHGQLNQ